MSEQNNPEEQRKQSRDAWEDVGKQFQTLGESLSMAFRAAWEDEETRARLQEMRSGIETMVTQVSAAIRDTAGTPQGQKVRSEAGRAAENLKSAGEQTMSEVRPHLVAALRQVNAELQKMINRMDENRTSPVREENHQRILATAPASYRDPRANAGGDRSGYQQASNRGVLFALNSERFSDRIDRQPNQPAIRLSAHVPQAEDFSSQRTVAAAHHEAVFPQPGVETGPVDTIRHLHSRDGRRGDRSRSREEAETQTFNLLPAGCRGQGVPVEAVFQALFQQ